MNSSNEINFFVMMYMLMFTISSFVQQRPKAQGFDHSFGHIAGCIDKYAGNYKSHIKVY
jgi:hypothetical protein